MDLTATTAALTAVGTDMSTIGVGIIGLAVIALSISWIKATFF